VINFDPRRYIRPKSFWMLDKTDPDSFSGTMFWFAVWSKRQHWPLSFATVLAWT